MTAKRTTSKTGWAKANDAGPHVATLPSGTVVKFKIPDAGQLLKAGRIPNHLREAAIVFTSHPDGTDELMRELVITAALRGPGQDTITAVINAGHELAQVLVAEMVIEPAITAEEIADGAFPELDIRMLLEFAERLRNVDADGNELPITTMDQWATFRRQPPSVAGAGDGRANGSEPRGDVSDADDRAV